MTFSFFENTESKHFEFLLRSTPIHKSHSIRYPFGDLAKPWNIVEVYEIVIYSQGVERSGKKRETGKTNDRTRKRKLTR